MMLLFMAQFSQGTTYLNSPPLPPQVLLSCMVIEKGGKMKNVKETDNFLIFASTYIITACHDCIMLVLHGGQTWICVSLSDTNMTLVQGGFPHIHASYLMLNQSVLICDDSNDAVSEMICLSISSAKSFLGCNIYGLLYCCHNFHSFKVMRIAECFAFLVCTKWYNPAIHRNSHLGESSSSSMTIRYLDWNRGLVISSDEDSHQNSRICNLQDIGGHVMKIPFICFQIMLFMHLEGTPPSARNISPPVFFSPLLLLQGAGVAHAALLGWWSIDEGSREEQARLYYSGASGYNTFSPDIVKKRPKSDLVEEIWRLQAALSEQTEVTKYSQQEFERLQYEKILCRVCFEEQISVVLLPCRHHVLCSTCCEKCKRCPICRVSIEERLPVYDV
ncbi:hypothetical protein GOBAR_AA08057 [Gossypium barbadense]|uniref:RING-type domain-containing protein n=1 Tax=Gossypium barbadense TaxID=3634 RepID=A0A2P5YAJ9_GOSBA|nr:hypothetical protein GOBAR_AA08057 [Gossypium barbadense]